jgi:predicted PurR-regulated permease PerM
MLVLLVVGFLLFEGQGIHDKLAILITEAMSDEDDLLAESSHEVQKYLIVKTLTSLSTGLLTGFWAAFLDLDFAILWGVLSFVLNFIPTIGSWIAVLPPFLLALVVGGPSMALALGVGFFIVNFTIGQVVEPRVMGQALGLSPTIVLLSMVIWGWLLGPVGAVVSVPLTMLLKIILTHSEDLQWVAFLLGPSPEHPEPLSALAPEANEANIEAPQDNVQDAASHA